MTIKTISKKTSWLIIAVFLLFLSLFDVLFYFSHRNKPQTIVDNIEQSDQEISDEVDLFVSAIKKNIDRIDKQDAKKWKKYTNNIYGVSFNYPSYYDKFEYKGRAGYDDPKLGVTFSAYNDTFVGRISFMIFEGSLEKSLEESISSSLENIEKSEVTINDLKGIKISGQSEANMILSEPGKLAFWGFENGNITYVFAGEDNEVLNKLINTINLK